MDDPKTGVSQDVQRVLEIYSLKERLIDKDLERTESRLNDRINKLTEDLKRDIDGVKKDLHDRISRLETRLQWSVTVAIGVTGIVVAIIVKFV